MQLLLPQEATDVQGTHKKKRVKLTTRNIHVGLKKRPKLAKVLGLIASELAQVESLMALVFAAALTGQWGVMVEPGVLERIRDFKVKCDLINAVARSNVADKALRERLRAALKDALDAATARNTLIHARWFTSPDHPGKAIWVKGLGPTWTSEVEYYDEKRLKGVLDRIESARNELRLILVTFKKNFAKTT